MTSPVIIVLIVLILVSLAIYFVLNRKKLKRDTKPNAMFILGIVFFIVGVSNDNSAMHIIGIVFFIAGWAKMNEQQKKDLKK